MLPITAGLFPRLASGVMYYLLACVVHTRGVAPGAVCARVPVNPLPPTPMRTVILGPRSSPDRLASSGNLTLKSHTSVHTVHTVHPSLNHPVAGIATLVQTGTSISLALCH